ncbi:hypothetical protein Calag_0281 [Caldisphaera lagunensis DSM 15908]|uniref:Uncharacterized protein n=1 Tax=Caldisphaera lagunensis (strain DSM 15908 / JCM 11604 / ANMR 0165 / IC-154) TaxID=1056495 RepID=L0A897_CALLD|nr:hypothetical protein [Caldisphaera lagunensis]AFZ70061.1 hypothetical protein Calag_0281 [Caldisphaera lagunensis DSM 15908]
MIPQAGLGNQIIYLNINAILYLISGIVALSVSYVSFKYSKIIEESLLNYISFGFILLGLGLVIQGSLMILLSFNIARFSENIKTIYISSVMYLILQVIAYIIISVGYSKKAYWNSGEALISIIFTKKREYFLLGAYIFDASQIIIIFLLSLIVFTGYLVHMKNKNTFSLLVLIAFSLMLISHITYLLSSLMFSIDDYFIANIIQFLGFLSLLIFLIRSGHIGRTEEK